MKVNAHRNGETGQALMLFALALAAMLGFVAIAVDAGVYFQERRSLQNAADAAALAAAHGLPTAYSQVDSVARDWAGRNGYGADGGATVKVVNPYKGDPNRVEVTINTSVSTFFGRALGVTSLNATARAVAQRGVDERHEFAVIALNGSACGSFTKGGSGTFTVSGGGAIAVNSDCDTALDVAGSGLVSAGGIFYNVAGGYVATGAIDPAPRPMPRPVADPLADLPPPSLAAVGRSPDSGGTAAAPATLKVTTGNRTLRPGVYYGGIAISSNANVRLEPGIYILAGGGFSLTGGGNVGGLGVMFYNTYDPAHNSGAGACTGITLAGGAGASFAPMSSGPYADILLWQDKACKAPLVHAGNGELTSGIYYLPTAQFRMTGTSDTGGKQIIADTITVSGTSNVGIASSPYLTIVYEPVKLVE